jgi:Asp-tRNA(Asn)/Glu-tRNA(Gln) amidotransferase A subunit family amidase
VIQDVLKRLKQNNKVYGHYTYIPSPVEMNDFASEHVDLFKKKVSGKTRYLFSVKDIFNTNLYPTEMGSILWKAFVAGNNARVISDLLWEGDILVGKTVTSEFAVHEETHVVNPWCAKRTVGTSSAGAPLSVLIDGLDFALATQTGGSIGRPASYCGVIGVKPSFGLIPRTGVLKTCDTFDTVGFFAKNLNIAYDVFKSTFKTSINHPVNYNRINESKNNVRTKIVAFPTSKHFQYHPASQEKLTEIKKYLHKVDYKVLEIEFPNFTSDILYTHEQIYSFSLSYYFANELENTESVSKSFKEFVERGSKIEPDTFIDLLKKHEDLCIKYDQWLIENKIDFVINPTTHGIAPIKDCKELPDTNAMYTFCRVPVIYLPIGFDQKVSMPLGFSISSRRFNDLMLLEFSKLLLDKFKINEGFMPKV